MEELDFIHIPPKSGYDADIAFEFFNAVGNEEIVKADKTLFVEDEKGHRLLLQHDKMYLLLEGEVELTINKNPVATVHQGQIFGEMATLTRSARSATATTKTQCRVISLDEKQFHAGLRDMPEFALMMMGVMAHRLRDMITRLNETGALLQSDEWKESPVFDKKLLAFLEAEVSDNATMRYNSGKIIMHEGQSGVFMYVVLEGQVAVTIHDRIVEKVGPGGMFGEMALIERSERLANAVAETDCILLAINRNVFLDLVKENPDFGFALLSAVGERALFMASQLAA
jgi:CRP-like cAMP-binding protein